MIREEIGEINGIFEPKKAARFACWLTKNKDIEVRDPASIAKKGDPDDKTAIPAGFVRLEQSGTASLSETGKSRSGSFAINGEGYTPTAYRVYKGFTCEFDV